MMGNYDGAELYEVIGIYIKSMSLKKYTFKRSYGLIQKRWVFTVRKINKQQVDRVERKELVFSKIRLIKQNYKKY